MSHRMVEWRDAGPGHRVGERQVVPETEAAAAIASGLALGVTLVRFKAAALPYAPGETAGLFDSVAAKLVEQDWVEVVPVRPPAPEQDAEDKGLSRPPADRMVRNATTKEAKS